MAHRGLSTLYPENTALAYTKAAQAGAYSIECDIQATSDGEFVCYHNGSLSTAVSLLTSKNGSYLWNYEKEIILSGFRYDADYLREKQALISTESFTDDELKICSLEDYLGICRAYHIWPQIDIKHMYAPDFTIDELAEKLVRILASYGFTDMNCSLSSGKQVWLTAVAKASDYKVLIIPGSDSQDSYYTTAELEETAEYAASDGYIQPSELPDCFTNGIASVSSDYDYIAAHPLN